jgi:positive regulator of sigma E activity
VDTTARVHQVGAERALLACESTEAACGRCAATAGCALRRLSAGPAGMLAVPLLAADGEPLAAGTRVTVTVRDWDLLRAAGRAYLPPLAGVLAGAALVQGLAPGGEGWMPVGAAAGLLGGWAAAREWLRRVPPAVTVRVDGSGS